PRNNPPSPHPTTNANVNNTSRDTSYSPPSREVPNRIGGTNTDHTYYAASEVGYRDGANDQMYYAEPHHPFVGNMYAGGVGVDPYGYNYPPYPPHNPYAYGYPANYEYYPPAAAVGAGMYHHNSHHHAQYEKKYNEKKQKRPLDVVDVHAVTHQLKKVSNALPNFRDTLR
ncbi:13724_t:CDS:2, partial [Ambispora leptoticha]